jgi:hypothetical protein
MSKRHFQKLNGFLIFTTLSVASGKNYILVYIETLRRKDELFHLPKYGDWFVRPDMWYPSPSLPIRFSFMPYSAQTMAATIANDENV